MRYAVYFCPHSDSALVRHAERWFGRSLFGRDVRAESVGGLSTDVRAPFIAAPRRYGFHATLKAPFRLRAGCSQDDLIEAVDAFAGETKSVGPLHLVVSEFKGFFALTLRDADPDLGVLADAVTRAFEPLRAALSAEDIARRSPESLSQRQRAYLETWGYPFVFDEFRCHLTLSERLATSAAEAVGVALRDTFAPHLIQPVPIDRLVVCREPRAGAPFTCIHTAALSGTPHPLA